MTRTSVESIAADQLNRCVNIVQMRTKAGAPRQRSHGRQSFQVSVTIEVLHFFDYGQRRRRWIALTGALLFKRNEIVQKIGR